MYPAPPFAISAHYLRIIFSGLLLLAYITSLFFCFLASLPVYNLVKFSCSESKIPVKLSTSSAIYIIEWRNLREKNTRMPSYIWFVPTLWFAFSMTRNYCPTNVSIAWNVLLVIAYPPLLFGDRVYPTQSYFPPLLIQSFIPAFPWAVHPTGPAFLSGPWSIYLRANLPCVSQSGWYDMLGDAKTRWGK